jgi:DNA replication protein DnaC
MMKKIEPYIIKTDEKGNEYSIDNPEYLKKVQREKMEFILKKNKVPSFYWNINFQDYKGDLGSKEIKQIMYYANNCHKENFKHIHLYLWGNYSTQKTALGINILKQGIKNGLKIGFILAGELIDCLMKLQGFSKDEDSHTRIKALKECDLLLIDDVGDINKSTFWKTSENNNMVLSCWDLFFREVLSSDTRVIMTSNFDIGIFKQYFGEAMHELIDRNFMAIQLMQSVKNIKKLTVQSKFEGIE